MEIVATLVLAGVILAIGSGWWKWRKDRREQEAYTYLRNTETGDKRK